MKKVFAIFLLFIVGSVGADEEAEASWPWRPYDSKQEQAISSSQSKPDGPWDAWPPQPAPQLPPRDDEPPKQPPPVKPYEPPPIVKCFRDLRVERICYLEMFASFITKKINLSPECCKVVSEISDDCVGTVFARFNDTFFAYVLKKYCSSKGGH